jgi:DNA repair photolyase
MRRFTGHQEAWGEFVDVKVNAPGLLRSEIARKKRPGKIWMSGVCDPYQPLEARYRLTRQCLQIVLEKGWPLNIQTRSALVLRDLDLLRGARDVEVGLSVTTADDRTRRMFEPRAPTIADRVEALGKLRGAGVRTYAMIAPLLPGAERLPELLADRIDYILVDRMNYNYGDWVYKKYKLTDANTDEFFSSAGRAIASACSRLRIDCRVLY